MGSAGSKNYSKGCRLSDDEIHNLETALKSSVSKNNGEIFLQEKRFTDQLSKVISQKIAVNLWNYLTALDGKSSSTKQANKSSIPWHHLLLFIVDFFKGSQTEHCQILMKLADPNCQQVVSGLAMTEFITEVTIKYFDHINKTPQSLSWVKGVQAMCPKTFSRYLLKDLFDKGTTSLEATYSLEMIERWQSLTPIASAIISTLFRAAFNFTDNDTLNREAGRHAGLLPLCTGASFAKFQSILSVPDIALINQHLPTALRDQWRYLFSTRQYGESFSQLLSKILDKGPNVIVVKDKSGGIFGGFASHAWKLQPQFAGNSDCFLFTLYPCAGIYNSTGYNDHYMYLNINQQTMPNGLGMGGQLEYFGLWIDNDYGKGKCSKTCTTYQSTQLSATLEFSLDTVEVWGVGPEAKSDTEGQRSILDKADPELKAILEMAGKTSHSDAIREADNKAEQQ